MRAAGLMFLLAGRLIAQMGSPGGGETQAIALHPSDPDIIYAAAAKGLCKTTRSGKDNWPAVGLETYSPRAIVLDPRHPDVIYAGTYEMGVFRSADAGESWQAVNRGLTDLHILSLAIDPTANARHVYAGTRAGVFHSADGGVTFERAGLAWSNAAWTLVFDPKTDPATLYYGGVGGVLKTTNGGQWWEVTGPQRR